MHRHLSLYLIAIALVSALLTLPAWAQQPVVGPLIELSRPNAVGSCNTGFNLFGTWPTDDTEEPFVAVNPVHPNNIVAAWIQGPFQDIIAASSFDGGHNWQRVPIPLTVCSGGSYPAAGDPWLSFAPNEDLYAIGLAGTGTSNQILVTKSTDGGLHWSAATLVSGTIDGHPSITADPTDARLVYAIWDGTRRSHGPPSFRVAADVCCENAAVPFARAKPVAMLPGMAGALVWFYLAPDTAQLTAAFFLLQIALNVATGPYQAAIPDHVPLDRRGEASSWMSAWQSLGNAIGLVVVGFINANSRAPNLILPSLTSMRRVSARTSVDLPQPDSPTSPTVSPLLMTKLTLSTA